MQVTKTDSIPSILVPPDFPFKTNISECHENHFKNAKSQFKHAKFPSESSKTQFENAKTQKKRASTCVSLPG